MRLTPFLIGALSLVTVLWLGGCGGGGEKREAALDTRPVDYGSSRDFPVPPEIAPNVNFWRNVYGVWGRDKVAFHDDEHMGVIYEVAQLPGPTVEGYTGEQRAFVRARQAYYQDKARDLERKVSANLPLTPDEQSLLAQFEHDGGRGGVYGASERVRTQRGLRDRFRRGLEISGRYDKAFREIMRTNGLPEDLAYLPHVESSFQTNAVSSAGATGVWQFMPATGRIYMNVNGAVDDRLCPIVSAEGAARYLSQAHNRLGTWPLAITSYNHGQGGMANAKAQFGSDFGSIVRNYQGKAFKFASRNYYAEFIAAREVAGHPDRYFPEGVRYESPWPYERLILASRMPADAVASHYGLSTASLASANPHWRSGARDGRTTLPAGTTVWLPSGSKSRSGAPAPYFGGMLAGRGSSGAFGRPVSEAAAAAAFRATKAEPVLVELSDRDAYPRAARAQPQPAGSDSPLAQVESRRAQEAAAKLPVADEWNAQYQPRVSANAPVRGRRGRVDTQSPWPESSLAAAEVKPARTQPRPAPTPVRAIESEPGFAPRVAAVPRTEPVRAEPKPAAPAVGEPRVAVARVPEPRVTETRVPEPRVAETRVPEPRVAQTRVPEPRVAETRVPEPRVTETRVPEPRVAETRVPEPPVAERMAADADLEAARSEPRDRRAARASRPEPKVARAAAKIERPEPKVARAEAKTPKSEPKPAPAEAKAARPEPKVAKAEPRDGKSTRTAKADTKDAKAGRTAKTDIKDAKAQRTAKADTKDAKADAKTAKTAKAEVKDAKADAKAVRTAKSDAKGDAKGDAKAERTAKAGSKDAKTDAKAAKTAKVDKEDKSGGAKVHVVKPQETLFRVASGNGISVAELRKLNKLGPNDNNVRPGQKLKVGT